MLMHRMSQMILENMYMWIHVLICISHYLLKQNRIVYLFEQSRINMEYAFLVALYKEAVYFN